MPNVSDERDGRAGTQTHVDLAGAAQSLGGMSGERVRRRIHEGKLDGYQIAGRWLVSRESIARYLDAEHEVTKERRANVLAARIVALEAELAEQKRTCAGLVDTLCKLGEDNERLRRRIC